jgi:hypothetical protein
MSKFQTHGAPGLSYDRAFGAGAQRPAENQSEEIVKKLESALVVCGAQVRILRGGDFMGLFGHKYIAAHILLPGANPLPPVSHERGEGLGEGKSHKNMPPFHEPWRKKWTSKLRVDEPLSRPLPAFRGARREKVVGRFKRFSMKRWFRGSKHEIEFGGNLSPALSSFVPQEERVQSPTALAGRILSCTLVCGAAPFELEFWRQNKVNWAYETEWLAGKMNVDNILGRLSAEKVDYLLIGGMNFLLRHQPELKFDVDVWARDTPANLQRLNLALRALGGAWGPTEKQWAPVPEDWRWLEMQTVFCLTTDHGALDIFREVRGLEGRYEECRKAATRAKTASRVPFISLSDEHTLVCRNALPAPGRRLADSSFARGEQAQNRTEMTRDQQSKRREERKRDRAHDPAQRWRQIQETITWAEANMAPEQRRNRPRVPHRMR